MTEVLGTKEMFSISYGQLIEDVQEGSVILLDDGLIELRVLLVRCPKERFHQIVYNAGTLKNKKGVNVPGVSVQLPGITEKDAQDILFGRVMLTLWTLSVSGNSAKDVMEIRELLEKNNGEHIQIIPKIENSPKRCQDLKKISRP